MIIAEVYLPKVDGVVIRTMNLIRRLQEAEDEILVVCPANDARESSPVPVVEFKSFKFPKYPEYRIGLPDRQLVQAVRGFRPDVIHYINPFAFGFRCFDVLQRARVEVPSIFSFHTLYGEFVKRYGVLKPLSRVLWWVMREYHNSAHCNLTVSTTMQEELIRRNFERVYFWPPAVDGRLFHPQRRCLEMRHRLSRERDDKRLLLTVSRLAPEKNVAFLKRVLPLVPNVTLAVVGDGPQRRELEREFRALDVNFVGYLRGEELAAAYASADAFVYASETETMGNVVLEAMASGLPVVAPAAGGIPSLIDSGNNGFLYPPQDAEAVAGQLSQLLDDEQLRIKVSAAGRASIEHRSWGDSAETVRAAYHSVIADPRATTAGIRRRRRMAKATVSALVLAFRAASLLDRGRSVVWQRVGSSAATM